MADPILLDAALGGDLVTVQAYLDQGLHFKHADLALTYAAGTGHLACVEALVPFVVGQPLGGRVGGGRALLWAARGGHVGCVAALIPVVTDATARTEALHGATEWGHLDCLLALLPVSDPRARTSLAVGVAAQKGYLACVEALIPVSCPRGLGRALAFAALEGETACVARLLDVAPVKDAWDYLRKRSDDPKARRALDVLAAHVTPRVCQNLAAEHPPGTFPAMDALLQAQHLQGVLGEAAPVVGRRRRM